MRIGATRSRREFICTLGVGATAGIMTAQGVGSPLSGTRRNRPSARAHRAYEVRREAALVQRERTSLPNDETNGDEERYATYFAQYSKGLPHDGDGQVEPAAYRLLIEALRSGVAADFLAVPMGGSLKQVNPQAAYTFTLQGLDSHHVDLSPPPAFASAEAAADLGEVYWQAILRDVAFADYATSPLATRASQDLSRFSAFHGPREAGLIAPAVLFRGSATGDRVGPYISQFLYQNVPHGVYTIDQRFRTARGGIDYGIEYGEWLTLQRGSEPRVDLVLEPERRFIRTGRDLARYVYRDYTFQAFLNAALILLRFGESYVAPNPYLPRACGVGPAPPRLSTEAPFCTFGGPQILDAVTSVAKLSLHAAWRQKWLVHRRLRPEEFAQRVDRTVQHGATYPVHTELTGSAVLDVLPSRNLLLPLAYPEGSPAHPSYPAGHAAIAGACATVLKAFFREDAPYPAPAEPSPDGRELVPFDGESLTIRGEIEKLASNISIGRNFAGIHYRVRCN